MILDILEEHIEEADFLFSQRQLAFGMLDLNGEDLVEMDERLRAHLNGLLLGQDAAWEFVRPFLAEGSTGEAFVASIVALEGGQPSRLDELEEALLAAPPPVIEGIRWACCLTIWSGVAAFLKRLLDHDGPHVKAVAIEAMAYRKIDPGNDALVKALDSPSEVLVLAGLHAVGQLRLRRHQRAVQDYASMGEPALQAAALESLAVLDAQDAHRQCLAVLKEAGPYAATGAALLGVFAKKQDLNVLVRAAGSPDNKPLTRAAILALGGMGDTDAVPFLIELLGNDELARVAGASLGQIFGDQLPDEELETSRDREGVGLPDEPDAVPPSTTSRDRKGAGLPDEPDNASPSTTSPDREGGGKQDQPTDTDEVGNDGGEDEKDWEPDDDLPRLSADAVGTWWSKNRYSFPAGMRYRDGKPYEPGSPPSSATPLGLVKLAELEQAIASSATQVAVR